ncbi:MAG: hypothetical protein E7523_00230 [Ruminococcaceae bacterium]|nr:hypothetical protein [Oscillospiraceae bacterium]
MTGQQLKNSILQMAVQGKLVPQDPNDEPASVLLERIRAEKEALIKAGKIKKEKNPSVIFRGADNLPYEKVGKNEPVCIADEVPFDIPDSWEWVRLGSLLSVISDGTHKTPHYVPDGVPFLSVQNISSGKFDFTKIKYITQEEHQKLIERIKPQKDDILFCRIGTLGKAIKCTLDFEFSIFVSLGLLRPVDISITDYLVFAINSPLGDKWIHDNKVGGGTHTYKINLIDIPRMLIPVPPLEEQKRIFDKLSVFEPLTEEYTTKENTLSILNASFSDILKKSILQEAVQGKLVPQDENDEPASVLLERIRAEKQALIKAGKIKRDKNESVIFRRDNSHYEKLNGIERCIDDEIPFEIPESWQWERWGNISQSIQYGYNAPAKSDGKIKMVRISDIHNNTVKWDSVPFCDIAEEDIETYLLKPNDILFARTGGTVGKSYLVTEILEDAIYAGYLIRTRYSNELVPKYLKYFMESELYWSQLRSGTIATAQPNCNGQTLSRMLLPIPPKAEQERITQMIDILYTKL